MQKNVLFFSICFPFFASAEGIRVKGEKCLVAEGSVLLDWFNVGFRIRRGYRWDWGILGGGSIVKVKRKIQGKVVLKNTLNPYLCPLISLTAFPVKNSGKSRLFGALVGQLGFGTSGMLFLPGAEIDFYIASRLKISGRGIIVTKLEHYRKCVFSGFLFVFGLNFKF